MGLAPGSAGASVSRVMTKRILLVHHPVSRKDDRASARLKARGHLTHWVCPGRGETLPDPREGYDAAIVYGGAEDLSRAEEWPYLALERDWVARWVETGKPFLGICLGAQLLAASQGARVAPHAEGLHEIGYVPVTPTPPAGDFFGLPSHVYQWHKEGFDLPAGAELLLSGPVFPHQAIRLGERIYGIQFHPEVPPEIMARWIEEAGHMLAKPGAQPAERHFAEAERYDPPTAAWLERFFDDWLEESHADALPAAAK